MTTARIRTIRGDIPADDFGFCHSHEHAFLAGGHPATLSPVLRIDDYDATVAELREFRAAGGRAMVDCQPLGCGRMERELFLASTETEVHLVASTGFHKLAMYPEGHWIRTTSEERLKDIFVHELTEGMYTGTDTREPEAAIDTNDGIAKLAVDAKAGIIKTAVDADRMADPDKRWFAAAAAASLATGAPIVCHTETHEEAIWLADYYMTKGVEPRKIILCHLDRTTERPETHRELARLGCYLEYDTIGRFKYHSDEEEAELLLRMLDWGLADRILLSLDTTRARLKHYGGDIGWTYLLDRFLPMLRDRYGVADADIHRWMVANPAEAFAFI
ncbi:hypothetical protein [Paenibacillus sp.]|uniref:phosphotriesterase family protein n=1 Tax=Paenibacillus sp. TaxID=58172 RepID=UPI002D2F7DFC|nr:hypothetical protein [Paenibacillus sp.]HZG56727.1 hypothetical protein [Paenibacillus sp.]